MTIPEAWQRFGLGNGTVSLSDFEARAAEVLKLDTASEINCIILDKIEILPDSDRPDISLEDFPVGIMGPKYFADSDLDFDKLFASAPIGDAVKPLPIYTAEEFATESAIPQEAISVWLSRLRRKQHLIFQGPPGTGKTYIAERLARVLASGSIGILETVQFHPSYGYEDFMHGIRPVVEEGRMTFERMPGRFLQFCTVASERLKASATENGANCVLIIDEINRANLSRVFGELMYLLEYRDKAIPLAGENKPFSIPENVYIIGTMNTADRSIALVDHALRRRFSFIHVAPDYDVLRIQLEKHNLNADSLIKALRAVNTAIDDPNYEVGISFFLKDGAALASTLKDVWEGEIEPYLEEYFYDQPPKLEPLRWKKLSTGDLAPWNEAQ
jgi:MoxR-like ATPase